MPSDFTTGGARDAFLEVKLFNGDVHRCATSGYQFTRVLQQRLRQGGARTLQVDSTWGPATVAALAAALDRSGAADAARAAAAVRSIGTWTATTHRGEHIPIPVLRAAAFYANNAEGAGAGDPIGFDAFDIPPDAVTPAWLIRPPVAAVVSAPCSMIVSRGVPVTPGIDPAVLPPTLDPVTGLPQPPAAPPAVTTPPRSFGLAPVQTSGISWGFVAAAAAAVVVTGVLGYSLLKNTKPGRSSTKRRSRRR
jgi:hypothetical protein